MSNAYERRAPRTHAAHYCDDGHGVGWQQARHERYEKRARYREGAL